MGRTFNTDLKDTGKAKNKRNYVVKKVHWCEENEFVVAVFCLSNKTKPTTKDMEWAPAEEVQEWIDAILSN